MQKDGGLSFSVLQTGHRISDLQRTRRCRRRGTEHSKLNFASSICQATVSRHLKCYRAGIIAPFEWQRARRLKCNPDAPQRALRLRALREGKTVFMAVPRLADERCFLRLDPARLGRQLTQAATIKGAARFGEPVTPEQLGRIDLVVAGSVAVNARGARVGKGGGYSDLEFALARAVGAVDARTTLLTTV